MGYQDLILDHLVDEELVDAGDIEDLRRSYGDDASAHLVVTELVDEETLLEQLAVCYDTPPAGYGDGLFVERDVFEELDADVLKKYEVVPVRRRGDGRVDVIVVEPLNEMARQILEEHFDTGIRQYIWPQIRFLQAHHFFLGEDLPDWARPYLREHPVTFGYATPDGELDVHRALENSRSLHVHQWDLDDVHDYVDACYDRDTLLKVLLGYAGEWLTNRLVSVFVKDGLQPYFFEDWPELSESIDGIDQLRDIHIDSGDVELLRTTDDVQTGDVDALGLSPLFETLQVEPSELLVAFPIQLAGRNAMSLIGVPTDRDSGIRLTELPDDFDFQALEETTRRVGSQLEELIRRAKNDALPPPAERIPPLPKPPIRQGLGFEDSLVEQKIANRKHDQERHRWEIVDISHVIEDSSASEIEEDSSVFDDESSTPELDDQSSVAQHESSAPELDDQSSVADDENLKEDVSPPQEQSSGTEEKIAESPQDSSVAEDDDATEDDEAPMSGIIEAAFDSESVEEASAPDQKPEASEADDAAPMTGPVAASPDSELSEVSESASVSDEGESKFSANATTFGMPTVDEQLEAEDDARGHRMQRTTPASPSGPDSDEILADEDSSLAVNSTGEDEIDVSGTEEPADVETKTPQPVVEQVSPTSSVSEPQEAPEPEEIDELETDGLASNSTGLAIPTGPSGVPMAQILRRPASARSDSETVDDEQPPSPDSEQADENEKNPDDEPPNSSETIMGIGVVSSAAELSDASDELELDDSSVAFESDDSAPEESADMDADDARNTMFDEMLEDEASDADDASEANDEESSVDDADSSAQLDAESSAVDLDETDDAGDFEQRPTTIPIDAIEEVESGPMAVEIEESLSMIDSSDQQKAFAAAEHLATAGASVLPKLDSVFPGRLFVDRYQYTVDTMPPVNEHGPVLEALVRIGEASLAVVDEQIDDPSLDRRFYSTYLLTELPAYGLLEQVRERLFDRDQQTRKLAKNIIYSHRHLDDFEPRVVAPLRDVLEESNEDTRIEVAADNLRRLKDIASVPLLIEHLQGHSEKVCEAVHQALQEITFQPLAPSPSEWQRWWFDADGQPRWQWLVEAMDSDDHDIRLMAFDEIEQLPGVEIDYHPEQPPKLRARAQQQLTDLFESQGG